MWVAQKVWEPWMQLCFWWWVPSFYSMCTWDVWLMCVSVPHNLLLSRSFSLFSSLCCLSLPALLSAQVRVGADHSGSPVSRGLPLLTAPACAYVPDHVSQRQPRHVSAPRHRCSLPTGEGPASAAALPGAPARGAGPRALPAAAAR